MGAVSAQMREQIERAIGLSFLQYAPDDTRTGAARELRDQIIAIIEGAPVLPDGVRRVIDNYLSAGWEFHRDIWDGENEDAEPELDDLLPAIMARDLNAPLLTLTAFPDTLTVTLNDLRTALEA